jgi:hypothetical protein
LPLTGADLQLSDVTKSLPQARIPNIEAEQVSSDIYFKIKSDNDVIETSDNKNVIFGSIVSNDADKVQVTKDGLLLFKKSSGYTTVTLHFEDESLQAGLYEFSIPITLGSVYKQQCDVNIGSSFDTLSKRMSFNGSNKKSWEKFEMTSPSLLAIYPGETHIEVVISGKAGHHKSIAPLKLKLQKKFPDNLSEKDGLLLANAASLIDENPENRIYLLESENNLDQFRQLFAFFSNSTTDSLLGKTSVSIIEGEAAMIIAEKLSIKLPAMVVMDGNYAVEDVLCFNTNQTACLLSLRKQPDSIVKKQLNDYVKTLSDSICIEYSEWISFQNILEKKPIVSNIEQGVVPCWNVISGWAGKAGLSLWGLNYESEICPNPGDRCPFSAFDRTDINQRWSISKTDVDTAETILDPSTENCTWGKGTAYACIYINAELLTDIESTLHLLQTGYYVTGWLDGTQLDFEKDSSSIFAKSENKKEEKNNVIGITDQGGEVKLNVSKTSRPVKTPLNLSTGWHRLLLKFVTQQQKNEVFAFKAKFTAMNGAPSSNLSCSVTSPMSDINLHKEAMRLEPLVMTSQSLNLLYDTDILSLNFDLQRRSWKRLDAPEPIMPIIPFEAKLIMSIKDYDGKEVARRKITSVFPGAVTLDFDKTLDRGYYSVSSSLYTTNGVFITAYPPDGFCVIGGTTSQEKRKDTMKVATTYYYMTQDKENKIYVPWMKKMGIYLNIGSSTIFPTKYAETAKKEGITLVADFYDTYSNDKFADKLKIVEMAAPYTKYFKSYNEIDHRPDIRMTSEKWVAREKSEYEAVKQVLPDGFYVGGSLVYPCKREWFLECLRLGIDKYHDAWDVHSYPSVPPRLESCFGNSSNESISGLNMAYEKVGRTNALPFWIGETGARASHGLDARRWQADMIAKMIAAAGSLDNVLQIGFLRPWHYNRSFSGVHNDIYIAHMPGDAATYTAVALIDGFPYERLNIADNVQAAKFGETIMLWSTWGKSKIESIPVKLPQSKYVLVDVVGRVTPIIVDADGTVKIEVSTSPVYILAANDYKRLTD